MPISSDNKPSCDTKHKEWKEENMVWNRIYYGHEVMRSILENIDKKHALLTRHWARYLCRAMMAGGLVALFLIFSLQVKTDLGLEFNKALSGLFAAVSFSLALVFIFFTNSELLTSNFMYFTVGQYYKKIRLPNTSRVLGLCLLGNLIGCALVALMTWSCNMLSPATVDSLVAVLTKKTIDRSAWEIFVRGIFANFFINVAIIISMQLKESFAKMVALMMGVTVFAYMGFEHVIANAAIYFLAMFFAPESCEFLPISKSFFFSLIGNYVGGGLVIGLFYAYLNDGRKKAE